MVQVTDIDSSLKQSPSLQSLLHFLLRPVLLKRLENDVHTYYECRSMNSTYLVQFFAKKIRALACTVLRGPMLIGSLLGGPLLRSPFSGVALSRA